MGVTRLDKAFLLSLERRELCLGVGQFAKTPAQVAIDAVLADALAHQLDRFGPRALQVTHAFYTDVPGETADVMANAADQLATVAPAGAPADPPGFQQNNREPALSQFDSRVDPGKPAADHADIGDKVIFQRREGRQRMSRCRVIGARMFVVVLIHLLDFTLLQERVISRMIAWGGVVEM
ncbi:hypothetical protein D3C84_736750 [compost metagenome]